jgi:hypothetical protein
MYKNKELFQYFTIGWEIYQGESNQFGRNKVYPNRNEFKKKELTHPKN